MQAQWRSCFCEAQWNLAGISAAMLIIEHNAFRLFQNHAIFSSINCASERKKASPSQEIASFFWTLSKEVIQVGRPSSALTCRKKKSVSCSHFVHIHVWSDVLVGLPTNQPRLEDFTENKAVQVSEETLTGNTQQVQSDKTFSIRVSSFEIRHYAVRVLLVLTRIHPQNHCLYIRP